MGERGAELQQALPGQVCRTWCLPLSTDRGSLRVCQGVYVAGGGGRDGRGRDRTSSVERGRQAASSSGQRVTGADPVSPGGPEGSRSARASACQAAEVVPLLTTHTIFNTTLIVFTYTINHIDLIELIHIIISIHTNI